MEKKLTSSVSPRLLNVKQAGEYLGLSPWTVRGLVWRGVLAPVQLPAVNAEPGGTRMRRVLLDRVVLDEFIERHRATEVDGRADVTRR